MLLFADVRELDAELLNHVLLPLHVKRGLTIKLTCHYGVPC